MNNFCKILVLALTATSALAEPASVNSVVKKKLKQETTNLRVEMTSAKNQTSKLIEDKKEIEKNLNDMRDWAIDQQKQALEYYNEKEKAVAALHEEKEKNLVTEKNYKRVKGFVGYLAGALLLFLYLRFGAGLVSKLAVGAGVYASLIEVLGPLGAFCLGYFAAYLYF